MGEDTQQKLVPLGQRVPGGERVTERAFVLAEGTLRVPPLPVCPAREAPVERTPVARPRTGAAAAVHGDQHARDLQLLVAEHVVPLRVVRRVGEYGGQWHVGRGRHGGRLSHHGPELRGIMTRPACRDGPEHQMALGLDDRRQLRKAACEELPRLAARSETARRVVEADVARRQAGGIDGERRPGLPARREEAAAPGAAENGNLERAEGPPFSSRRAA